MYWYLWSAKYSDEWNFSSIGNSEQWPSETQTVIAKKIYHW